MTKLVLLHRADSIYDDDLEKVYDFPKQYLRAVQEAVGDWVLYFEPVKAGPRGYFAVARIRDVVPKPDEPGRFLAIIETETFINLDTEVPRLIDGRPLESALTDELGMPKKGGAQQLAVRRIPDREFERIVSLGLPANLEDIEARRYEAETSDFAEDQAAFERPVIERLTRRPYRDIAFRRKVREAYGFRCAFSGIQLRNGGGRPEVQAAHIRPVEDGGSDSVRNGLALSGTLHWMFERGLIAVADDMTILVSRNKVPADVVDRLIVPGRKLMEPNEHRHRPSRALLRWHREYRFGQIEPQAANQWTP